MPFLKCDFNASVGKCGLYSWLLEIGWAVVTLVINRMVEVTQSNFQDKVLTGQTASTLLIGILSLETFSGHISCFSVFRMSYWEDAPISPSGKATRRSPETTWSLISAWPSPSCSSPHSHHPSSHHHLTAASYWALSQSCPTKSPSPNSWLTETMKLNEMSVVFKSLSVEIKWLHSSR